MIISLYKEANHSVRPGVLGSNLLPTIIIIIIFLRMFDFRTITLPLDTTICSKKFFILFRLLLEEGIVIDLAESKD